MTHKEYLEQFQKEIQLLYELTNKKNQDYSGQDEAFKNLFAPERLGLVSTEKGILVRMCDKFQRAINLIEKEGKVKDEKIQDTLQDLADYSIILKIHLDNKAK